MSRNVGNARADALLSDPIFSFNEIFDANEAPKRGRKRKTEGRFLKINTDSATMKRYDDLFASGKWQKTTHQERLRILLNLAKTHPNSVGQQGTAASAAASITTRSSTGAREVSSDDGHRRPRSAGQRESQRRQSSSNETDEEEPEFGGYEINDDILNHELRVVEGDGMDEEDAEDEGELSWDDGVESDDDENGQLEPITLKAPNGKDVLHAPPLLPKSKWNEFYSKYRSSVKREYAVLQISQAEVLLLVCSFQIRILYLPDNEISFLVLLVAFGNFYHAPVYFFRILHKVQRWCSSRKMPRERAEVNCASGECVTYDCRKEAIGEIVSDGQVHNTRLLRVDRHEDAEIEGKHFDEKNVLAFQGFVCHAVARLDF